MLMASAKIQNYNRTYQNYSKARQNYVRPYQNQYMPYGNSGTYQNYNRTYGNNTAYDNEQCVRRAESSDKAIMRLKQVSFIILSIIIFTVALILIYFKAVISSVQMQINEMNIEIMEVQQQNSRMEAEIIEAGNIENIKIEASALGMAAPTHDQVVLISLNSYNDTELSTTNSDG